MAPALVELSTSKERNSNSKKYIEKFRCISHLSLELVDKFGFNSSFYSQNKEVNEKTKKENNSLEEVMVSNQTVDTFNITKSHTMCNNDLMENDIEPTSFSENGNFPSSNCFRETPGLLLNECINMKNLNQTDTERTEQPVATYTPSDKVMKILSSKQTFINSKFSSINSRLNALSDRLNKFHKRDISSNVACFITKSEKLHSNSKLKDFNEMNRIKKEHHPLKTTYDLLGTNGLTDDEDDLDLKQKIPLRGKRHKSIRPVPPSSILNQWKQNRVKIGSQCSWLTLKMTALDEKISSLNRLHLKLKTNRTLQKHAFEESHTKQNHTLTQNKNGFISKEIEAPLNENFPEWGCSRSRPVKNTQHHKYVSNESICLTFGNRLYRCRCLSAQSCRICNQLPDFDRASAVSLVQLCDLNFHPILSQKNDISLAILFEETLRHQQINTKVTITKCKEKKKRSTNVCRNTSPVHNKFIDKQPSKAIKKSERSKSDEYSRKRYAASDISGKLKKFRKLSESCDSGSKPSTPTNELASPLSQSLPSGGLSGLKRKKGSASVDYDINNIVIPYSIAASTRVERIQYKEIPTPGWRAANDMILNNGAELDRELTDDETYCERHAKCEMVEHKRFTDYFQPVRRQRSNRISEGPNSEPLSPFLQDDQPLVNTPVESPNLNLTLHAKLQNRLANIYACNEDERDLPWFPRVFPLSETDCQKLEDTSAPPSPINQDTKKHSKSSIARSPSFTILHNTPRNSPLPSPSPFASPPTTESNWTVKVLNEEDLKDESVVPVVSGVSEKQRKGIVLKLAKK